MPKNIEKIYYQNQGYYNTLNVRIIYRLLSLFDAKLKLRFGTLKFTRNFILRLR